MPAPEANAAVLPDETLAWISDATGGAVVDAVALGGGGREGYGVDVLLAGETRRLFLLKGRAEPFASFLPIEREAEVLRAVEPLGIPVPHVWAVDAGRGMLLLDRAEGVTWFQPPRDQAEQESVAKDFVTHLAAWHQAGARALDLPSFQPVRSIRDHQVEQLAGIRRDFEAQDAQQPLDALARLELDLLEKKLPDAEGEPVLVQGDTGPGNLMYADGRVTAIIDWELAHIGDPMDDIAWFSWRTTQHSFPDFPARLREYERLSGIPVDDDRVRYYRVNAIARLSPWFGLPTMTEAGVPRSGIVAGNERSADGSQFVMSMLHRRMVLTAIAELAGLPVPPRLVDDEPDAPPHNAMYDGLLGNLQTIVPRITDRSAANVVKGVARHLKYLKEIDRNGRVFEREELDEIIALLGRSFGDLGEARRALADAARDEKVPIEDYVAYHFRRMTRDDWLMRAASGALYERAWPALR